MNVRLSLHGAAVATLLTILGIASSARAGEHFSWTDLVSDIHGVTRNQDSELVNPWGLVPGSDGHGVFVSNNGTGTATHYNLLGVPLPVGDPKTIAIPVSTTNTGTADPAGVVLNHVSYDAIQGADSFVITKASASGPSHLLFCSEDGSISGYSDAVDPLNAILKIDNSATGAIYTGLALSFDGAGTQRLYVANFGNGKVEVYKNDFSADATVATAFNTGDPSPVTGYAPYNVKHYSVANATTKKIDRFIVVSYAFKTNPTDTVPTTGAGLGYVDIFTAAGVFVNRLVDVGNDLDTPWGMAVGRHAFGKFGNVLFVGNFGDGKIHRYSLANSFSGTAVGSLKNLSGEELQFDGLHALHFGAKALTLKLLALDFDELDEPNSVLYFSAGIAEEGHGLVGAIVPH